MSSRSTFKVARQPLALDTPTVGLGRRLRAMLRRAARPCVIPFTYMWTNLRTRAKLNEAYAAQKRAPEGEPTRAWRRDFIRGELRRLRPIMNRARPRQTRLRYGQLWRLSLTAEE